MFAKLEEESAELRVEVEAETVNREAVEEEFGDLLFTAMNLARHLKVDPESALRAANAKFRRRFMQMEENAGGREALAAMSDRELEELWSKVKSGSAEEQSSNKDK